MKRASDMPGLASKPRADTERETVLCHHHPANQLGKESPVPVDRVSSSAVQPFDHHGKRGRWRGEIKKLDRSICIETCNKSSAASEVFL